MEVSAEQCTGTADSADCAGLQVLPLATQIKTDDATVAPGTGIHSQIVSGGHLYCLDTCVMTELKEQHQREIYGFLQTNKD